MMNETETLQDAPEADVLTSADRRAVEAQVAVEPRWVGIATAGEAFGLPERVVLHAGPPFTAGAVSQPVLNSAAMAAVFEGWARDEAEAFALLRSGEIVLQPAQDHGAVVPLASVLTRSMAVQVVADGKAPSRRRFSPLNGGSGPALRLGMAGPAVVEHLRWLNGPLADYLAGALREEIALIPLADAALAEGDDCHGRTPAATALLWRRLSAKAVAPAEIEKFIAEGPSFFLNLWMAACKCILSGAEGVAGSSVVVAIGGNGLETGIKTATQPQTWTTAPAAPPSGRLEPGFGDGDRLGAIGDSAVVDALGMGAMALHYAPAQAAALASFMPAPSQELSARLFALAHPGFQRSPLRIGLPAARVGGDRALAISLGIIHREGRHGRIGGGVFVPPPALFSIAASAVA